MSSLSTEKQQFSQDGLSGVSLQRVVVWVVQNEISPLTSRVHRTLGATSELTQTPYRPPTLSIAQDRVEQLSSMIRDVLESRSLTAAMAWDSAALRCLVGLAEPNFVRSHVANMNIVSVG